MCIPGLHLSLGIYDRLWNLLCDACHELDLKLAGLGGNDDGSIFSRYSNAIQRRSTLELEIETQKNYVTLIDQMATYAMINSGLTNDFVTGLKSEAATTRHIIHDLV